MRRALSLLARRDALLFTPGPLTTSATTKAAMQRDVGSRDPAFLRNATGSDAEALTAAAEAERWFAVAKVLPESYPGLFRPADTQHAAGSGFASAIALYNRSLLVAALPAASTATVPALTLFAALRFAAPVIPPMVRSPFSNLFPDVLVLGPRVLRDGYGGVLLAGYFDARWELDEVASWAA